MSITLQDRFRGCLLGGATGDALGAPVEFMDVEQIRSRFGAGGIRAYAPAYGRRGAITDDTQMTLFTAEGLLRARVRHGMGGVWSAADIVDHAYLRWAESFGIPVRVEIAYDGWLWYVGELHDRRAPGHTCIGSLRNKTRLGEPARNTSKGCGGVMRIAPVGLWAWHERHSPGAAGRTFDFAAELAGLTHGHPSGQWPAAVMAVLILRSLEGIALPESLAEAKAILRGKDSHEETLAALERAEALAACDDEPSAEVVESLGGGWVAEETLAIAVYCALVARDFEHGVVLAVNHSGDSDSTGAITGNLLGALHGVQAIPPRWFDGLELRTVIEQVADDLLDCPAWNIGENGETGDERIRERYPGW